METTNKGKSYLFQPGQSGNAGYTGMRTKTERKLIVEGVKEITIEALVCDQRNERFLNDLDSLRPEDFVPCYIELMKMVLSFGEPASKKQIQSIIEETLANINQKD